MPADRAFSFISKKVKKVELVLSPTEYDCIVTRVGNLFIVGEHLRIYDYKSTAADFLKVPNYYYFVFCDYIFS